ncbi:MAG: hypothetical protein LBC80_06330 [Treponema sp.]|jgi:hypothetical protein|nr:hypothetical protein [Treponema sp.]
MNKFAIFLILFASLAVGSFAETLYGGSVNIYRTYEQYPKENCGRDLTGVSFYMSLNHFPGDSSFGWYIKTSIGGYIDGDEWKDNEPMETSNIYSSFDLRLSAGPSYLLKAGSMILVPISVGPVLSRYREETSDGDYGIFSTRDGFFETLNMGLLLDAAVVINPTKRFTITNGITINWDFLRWEKGNAKLNYRDIDSGRFKNARYNAFKLGYYFGVGMRFDGSDAN